MKQKHYLMRFLTLITSLLLTSVIAHAGQISEQEAMARAKAFMQGKNFKTSGRRLTPGRQVNQTFKHLYVFNVEASEGFVIVSGDDRTQSILGYAHTGELDMGQMPCNVRWLLSYYDAAIGQLADDYTPSSNTTLSGETSAEIPAIVSTQWGQGDPYNAMCPLYEGERCITGCVATAMAQVMNHNRWPQSATADIPAYTTSTHAITMPALPAKQFYWDNMTVTAIAELMLYCGQAVKMDYTSYVSSASSIKVPEAMKDIFGYSSAVSIEDRGKYSNEQWAEMLYRELQNGYPVLYSGWSSTGGGHAFIVDGYADGKYHINWGWNGYCDGYFTLDELNPNMENGFNKNQSMVVNAWRPAGAEDTNRPKTAVKGITTSTRFLERTATGEAFPTFTMTTTVENDMSTAATIQTGLALYGDNGIVAMLSQDSHDFTVGGSYTAEKEVTIGADIQPGEYRIVSVNRLNDSDPWLSDQGSSDRYIAVNVAETFMNIQPMPKSEDEVDIIDFGIHTIDGITYQLVSEYGNNRAIVKLYNETENYKGDIYIPDYVTYQNMKFKVNGMSGIYGCPELTSLSSPISFIVYDCPALKSVEIREGALRMERISRCPLIESITYPSTCSEVVLPQNCQGLKTLTFLYKRCISLKDGTSCLSAESLPSLTDIYIDSNMPPTVEGSTETVNPNVTIHVPQGSLENYKQSAWKDWKIVDDRAAVPVRVNWDYCGPCEDLPYRRGGFRGIAVGRGENDAEFAMRIPAEHLEAYKGCRISAIEYFTPRPFDNDNQTANVEYVFITSRGKDYITKQSVNTVRGQWMRIELNQPYTITGEELFVGIGRHSKLSAFWANEDIAEDGSWIRVMGNDTNYRALGLWDDSDINIPLPIRALIEGDNLPDDIAMSSIKIGNGENTDNSKQPAMAAVTATETDATEIDTESRYFTYSVGPDGKIYAPQPSQTNKSVTATTESAGKKTISFKVRNRSMRTVRQITLDTYVDGVQQKPITIDTYLPTNWEDNVTIVLPELAGRNHNMTFNVTDIDGKPDAVPFNSWGELNYSLNPATYFPRKIVMEEATGTWCGWCPRGMATIEQMSKKYPDNFIAIAVHDGDKMQPDNSYNPFLEMVNSYPLAHINRKAWRSPFPFDLEDIMDKEEDKGEAKVTTQARCLSAKEVEVESETVFGFSDNGTTEYRLAYVVTEDNVGPYKQANYYSNPTAVDNPDDYMNWWVHQSSSVEVMFNEVARAIYSYDGVEGLLPKAVTEGETYKTKYTLTVPDNVKDLSNVRIVTLLLDTRTGEILNADRCSLSDIPDTSISNITTDDNKRHDIFNSLGMKVGTDTTPAKGLRKGLYIMNGRKVIIR